MNPPFEGLLGDTCETRLLQFLLPMYGIEFTMAELVEETGLTRQSVAKAMNKFAVWEMVKKRKEGRTPHYSINEDSPLVKRLEDFDNSLIEAMVGPEVFEPVRKRQKKAVRIAGEKIPAGELKKMKFLFSQHDTKVSGVASSEEVYSPGKKPGRKKMVAG